MSAKKKILDRPLSATLESDRRANLNLMEELPPSARRPEGSSDSRPHSALSYGESKTVEVRVPSLSYGSDTDRLQVHSPSITPSKGVDSVESRSPSSVMNNKTFLTGLSSQALPQEVLHDLPYYDDVNYTGYDMGGANMDNSSALIADLEGKLSKVTASQDRLRIELAQYLDEINTKLEGEEEEERVMSIIQEEEDAGASPKTIVRPPGWDKYLKKGGKEVGVEESDPGTLLERKIQRGKDAIRLLDEKLIALGETAIYQSTKSGRKLLADALSLNESEVLALGEGGRRGSNNKSPKAKNLKEGEIDHIQRNAQLVANGSTKLTLEEEARVARILGKDYIDEYDEQGHIIGSEDSGTSAYIDNAINSNAYGFDDDTVSRLNEIEEKLSKLSGKYVVASPPSSPPLSTRSKGEPIRTSNNNNHTDDSETAKGPVSSSRVCKSQQSKLKPSISSGVSSSGSGTKATKKEKVKPTIDYLRNEREDKIAEQRIKDIDATLAALESAKTVKVGFGRGVDQGCSESENMVSGGGDGKEGDISPSSSNTFSSLSPCLRIISQEEIETCRRECLQEVSPSQVASRDQIEMLLLSMGVSRSDF